MTGNRPILPQEKGQMFVADGGIETYLIFQEGEEVPHFNAFLLYDSERGREKMRKYYLGYLPIAKKAGQGFLIDTNTGRANPDWGALVDCGADKLKAVNMRAIGFSREIAAAFKAEGVPTVIGGVVGPRRDGWQFDAEMTVGEAREYHAGQIAAFAEAGADMVAAYTLTNAPEAIGIADRAKAEGLPCALSFTLEADGHLPGGRPLGEVIAEVDADTGGYATYYMINCVHPVHFAATIRHGDRWVDRIGGLRVNASMKTHAELDESETLDVGDWNDLAQRYQRLMPLLPNIRVLGGCCGTDHRHIGAICHHCLPRAEAA